MAKTPFSAIILAAGKGTRMNSPLPKILHPVAGHPMIHRAVKAVKECGAGEVRVVVGYGENLVRQVVEPLGAVCFKQDEQKGTANAVHSANLSTMGGTVLILNGDHPLLTSKDVSGIIEDYHKSSCDIGVVTVELDEPGSYGRIVRSQGMVKAIVEAKDAGVEGLKIREVNTGIYVAKAEILQKYLPQVHSHNAQGEFYLTDIIALCVEDGGKVEGLKRNERVAFGVNKQEELAIATKKIFRRTAKQLMENGVVIIDPNRVYVEEDVEVGAGSVIYPGVYIKGPSRIGSFCVLEPNCFLNRVTIGDSVEIKAGSYLDTCSVKTKSVIGPYAHLRPGTEIGEDCKVGNFVEMKKVQFGDRSKASHLSYLGDASVGTDTNIGCGTITCNYAVDKKKYITKIGSDVFVGSDSQLIAPVEIGDGAVIGSGSTITKDVPARALAVNRRDVFVKENYSKGPLFKKET